MIVLPSDSRVVSRTLHSEGLLLGDAVALSARLLFVKAKLTSYHHSRKLARTRTCMAPYEHLGFDLSYEGFWA